MMKNIIFITIIIFCSCNGSSNQMQRQQAFKHIVIPSIKILQTDSSLHFKNGFCFYGDTLFSGTIEEYFTSHQLKSSQSFYKGKEEGCSYSFYEDGKQESKRYFHLGEKDSINLGWWSNGNLRFEYHFNNGIYDGDYKEWYFSGKALKYLLYKNGEELSGKGWRENGKLFMNYVMKDNRRYGLMNSQLCYSLKNEKGEFVKSSSDTTK